MFAFTYYICIHTVHCTYIQYSTLGLCILCKQQHCCLCSVVLYLIMYLHCTYTCYTLLSIWCGVYLHSFIHSFIYLFCLCVLCIVCVCVCVCVCSGAPNIGRRSLKTRLLNEYPSRFAEVKARKSTPTATTPVQSELLMCRFC